MSFREAKMLLDARRRGVSFEKTLTIAHQGLYLHPREVKQLRKEYLANDLHPARSPLDGYIWGQYSDSFLHDLLGAAKLDILDNSTYEGATFVHDLNQPVPQALWGKYDAVIECGSLEHVFNFPVAMASLMRMLRVGGSLFLSVPANNLCGHGFYQFSPELMFRVFSPENGFRLVRVVLLKARFPGVELGRTLGVYEVTDPATVRKRVGLLSSFPAMIMVEAIKTEDVTPFTTAPQQSDYVALWRQEKGITAASGTQTALERLLAHLPDFLRKRLIGHYFNWIYSFRNRRFYRKLS
jgi:hypothetical protein